MHLSLCCRLISRRVFIAVLAGFAIAFELVPSHGAAAYTFHVLHAFCARTYCADGQTPKYPPIRGSNGVLYGNTAFGGGGNNGVVYSLTPNGTGYDFKVLYSFIATPGSPLIVDTKGNLYGTTVVGGAYNKGTFFELKHNADRTKWTEVTRYSFCPSNNNPCPDGQYPSGPLTYPGAESGAPYDGVSALYGATPYGGTGNGGNGAGVAFRFTPVSGHTRWKEKVLYNFCSQPSCTDGSGPDGGLIIDSHGHLFGTTLNGGVGPSNGTVFKIIPNQLTETVLYPFCPMYPMGCAGDGYNPDGPLTLDGKGHLFGTTASGGAAGKGTIFKLSLRTLNEVVLHSFCGTANCPDGAEPNGGLVGDSNGNLFGMTSYGGAYAGSNCDGTNLGCGTIFRLHGNKLDRLTNVHSFCKAALPDCADGAEPMYGKLLLDSSGNLSGVAQAGGAHGGGTVFKLTP